MQDNTEIRINVIRFTNGTVTSATETIPINQWKNETARGALAAAVIDSLLRRGGWREGDA